MVRKAGRLSTTDYHATVPKRSTKGGKRDFAFKASRVINNLHFTGMKYKKFFELANIKFGFLDKKLTDKINSIFPY